MAATRALWFDVHAHPGRCFVAGLDAGDPPAGLPRGLDVVARPDRHGDAVLRKAEASLG
jgi:hypothetical protein